MDFRHPPKNHAELILWLVWFKSEESNRWSILHKLIKYNGNPFITELMTEDEFQDTMYYRRLLDYIIIKI